MSLRVDTSSLIANAIVCGHRGLGVLGDDIPSTGDNGGSFLYNDLSLPSDNGKEICGRITAWPSAGSLFAYEDGSFEFTGAPDGSYSFAYQLYVDGVASGTGTAYLQVGSVTAGFSLTSESSNFSGGAGCGAASRITASTGDAAFAGGAYMDGVPAACVFSTTSDDAVFYGAASVSGIPASCSFALAADSALFSGAVVTLTTVWPLTTDVRLGVTYGPTGTEYTGTMAEGGGTYPTAESIAAAVVSALQGTTIPVNIKQVNDVTVQGAGTKLNPWQPV